MFIPPGEIVHRGLATSYVLVEALVADLCEGGFSGVVEVVLRETDSFIVISVGSVMSVVEAGGNQELNGATRTFEKTTVQHLADRCSKERGRISVYSYSADTAAAVARRINAQPLYINLSTEFTDIEKMMSKLVREYDREWFIELNNDKGSALIHICESQCRVINSTGYSDSGSLISTSNVALGRLIDECNRVGGTFDVYFTENVGDDEEETADQVNEPAHLATELHTNSESQAVVVEETSRDDKTETFEAGAEASRLSESTYKNSPFETADETLHETSTVDVVDRSELDELETVASADYASSPTEDDDPIEDDWIAGDSKVPEVELDPKPGEHAYAKLDSLASTESISRDEHAETHRESVAELRTERDEQQPWTVQAVGVATSNGQPVIVSLPETESPKNGDGARPANTAGLSLIRDELPPAAAGSESMNEAKRLMGEIARIIEEAAKAVGRPDAFSMSLRAGQLKVADSYPFLDPFAGEFEYLAGEIVFVGYATAEEFVTGLTEALKLATEAVMRSTPYAGRFRSYITDDLKRLASRELAVFERLGMDQVIPGIIEFVR